MSLKRMILPAVIASALAAPLPVAAHARFVPASGATVTSPRGISLTFNERFAVPFSSVTVEDSRGRAVDLTRTLSEDGRTLGGTYAAPLPAGTCCVTWAIAAVEGRRMTATHSSTVR